MNADAERAGADRLHDRRRQRGAGGARPRPRRRGRDQRRGAPGRARAAGGPARAARRERPGGPVRRAGGRGRPRHPAGGHLARLVAHRARSSTRPRWPPPARWCCSTAPRASAPCPSTCASSAATSTPPRGRNGCAARTGSATCTCAASSRRACPPPGPSYGNMADPTRALEFELQPDARRFALGFPAPHQVDWALAALDVLEQAGLAEVQAARDRPGRPSGASGSARACARAGTRRSWPGRWTSPRPRSSGSPRRASRCATCRGPGPCAPRSGAWSSEAQLDRLAELTCR